MDNEDERLKIDKENEYDEKEEKNKKRPMVIFIAVIVVIAAVSGAYFGLNGGSFAVNSQSLTNVKNTVMSVFKGVSGSSSSAKSAAASSSSSSSALTSVFSSASSSAGAKEMGISFDSSTKSVFKAADKGFFHFSKDGVKFYDNSVNQLWNYTYTMSSITVLQKGNYACVMETNGRALKMYSPDGELYSISCPGTILNVYINAMGQSVVLLNCGDEYRTQVYSESGDLVFERYEQDADIYPVSAALSDDGKIVDVSYLDASGVDIKSTVLFFYTSRSDSKNIDTGDFFAAVEKSGQIVPMAGYNAKTGFMFLGDKEVFAVSTEGKEIWATELTNKIEKAYFDSNGNIVAGLGSELSDKDGHGEGAVVLYNQSGEEKVLYDMGEKITYMNVCGTDIIVGSGKSYCGITSSGKVNWQYTASQDISDIMPLNGNNLLLVTSTNAAIVKSSDLEKAAIEE